MTLPEDVLGVVPQHKYRRYLRYAEMRQDYFAFSRLKTWGRELKS